MPNPITAHSAAQFGAHAAAYVASPVHAEGPDLDWLAAQLAPHMPARLLDAGAGGGHASFRAATLGATVTAMDPSAAMLAALTGEATRRRHTIQTLQAAAESLPLPAASFDIAITRFSAHHWANLAAGLRELARILPPGGRLFIVDSAAPTAALADTHLQTIEKLRDTSHVRNYTAPEWVAALAGAGFTPTALHMLRRRMEFASWIARTQTPPWAETAITKLQTSAPPEIRTHFAITADGSFDLDVLCLAALRS